MAVDEHVRVRRFLSFRVFWKLVRMLPVFVRTQARAVMLWCLSPAGGWAIFCEPGFAWQRNSTACGRLPGS